MSEAQLAVVTALKAQKLATIGLKLLGSPVGFGYKPPFNVYRDRTGIAFTDFDITKSRITGKAYYVSPSGSNSNDGLSWTTAFATMAKAYSMPDVKEIRVLYGLYERSKGLSGVTISKDISIIGYGGQAIFSCHDILTWTASAGYTNTYQSVRSSADGAWDAKNPDSKGDYSRLTKRTSIAEVDANPGSWYSDGTNVYVRTSDSRQPDSNIRVYLGTANGLVSSGTAKVYLEGITFEGGYEPFKGTNGNATTKPTIFGNRCIFKYGSLNNGVTIQGADTFFVNCETARNNLDGFNYHFYNNLLCTSVEIDCIGRHNGYTNLDNNNGSTTHDGNTILRIRGEYFGNKGPNIADVNNAKVWLIEPNTHDSLAVENGSNINLYIDGQMWVDSAKMSGSKYDIVVAISGSAMYVKNMMTPNMVTSIASGASLVPY